ncbi:energy-coupling factor transporter transmembrane component T [Rothia dentocariosa]|uniref:energy-coupling factor transporter transmembrane component T n=1 Tax=Rothia dentocariosa TaxID=2047 RepID=UPI0019587934|nr:energy-coupling factor transporter transmembrane component T [Rothia dentocariosa]VTY11857.1 Cobalt transport protein [Rothia dentocariosa]
MEESGTLEIPELTTGTASGTQQSQIQPEGITSHDGGMLDPRSLVLLTLLTNIIAVDSSAIWLIVLCILTTAIFSLCALPRRLFLGWAGFEIVCAFCAFILPAIAPSHIGVAVGVSAFWFLKFNITAAFGIAFFTAITPHQVSAVLTRLRAPVFIYVPIMVMYRFFPAARDELTSIREAMVLRGLQPGLWAMIIHPMHYLELILIPFLLSATRIVDELSAAALLKAVGAGKSADRAPRTTIIPTRFTRYDALAIGLCIVLVVAKEAQLWMS